MADRYDDLKPVSLIATLRSLERRYTEVSGLMRSDPDLLSRVDEPGPDGQSMTALFNRSLRAVSMLAAEAERIITHTEPISPAAALDPQTWSEQTSLDATLTEATDVIGRTGTDLADRLENLDTGEWNRTSAITGGGSISLVEVVRTIAREAIETLRLAERQLEHLRS